MLNLHKIYMLIVGVLIIISGIRLIIKKVRPKRTLKRIKVNIYEKDVDKFCCINGVMAIVIGAIVVALSLVAVCNIVSDQAMVTWLICLLIVSVISIAGLNKIFSGKFFWH